jgi:hypothetical protein
MIAGLLNPRGVLVTLFAVLVAAFGALYLAYGQADPCRALAVEKARRSDFGAFAERIARMQTSQMTTAACAGGLLDSWGERITHYW